MNFLRHLAVITNDIIRGCAQLLASRAAGRGGSVVCAAVWMALGASCGAEDVDGRSAAPGPIIGGSRTVVQGGPQDFARFRAVVRDGQVPDPSLLDPVGFFAEHAIDLPPADCGEHLCAHPSLAVAPRFDGTNWTMAFVGLNTPVDPTTLPRPDVHVVLAIEASADSSLPPSVVADALPALLDGLRDGDRVSLVTYDRTARLHTLAVAPAEVASSRVLRETVPAAGAAPYEAVARAAEAIEAATAAGFTGAHRIVLVTTGLVDAGITSTDRIVSLVAALAKRRVSFGVVGYGSHFDARLPRAIGDLGAATYAYAADATDLEEVLRLEGQTTLFPLATEVRMRVVPAPGYRVGRLYGAARARVEDGVAVLETPALFVGQRRGASDVGGGRRGGGGGLFVELVADAGSGVPAGAPAFELREEWTRLDGTRAERARSVSNALPPGVNPDGMWPSFSEPRLGKAFMMLNMYLALRATTDLYADGDCARARGVVQMMTPATEAWLGRFDDPDIEADYALMLALDANLQTLCRTTHPIEPRTFDGGCFFL
jgi:Ca-activated chloride channel family protein